MSALHRILYLQAFQSAHSLAIRIMWNDKNNKQCSIKNDHKLKYITDRYCIDFSFLTNTDVQLNKRSRDILVCSALLYGLIFRCHY